MQLNLLEIPGWETCHYLQQHLTNFLIRDLHMEFLTPFLSSKRENNVKEFFDNNSRKNQNNETYKEYSLQIIQSE